MDKRLLLQLNGNRRVTGVLRGYDPFMNIVLDDAVEEVSATEKNHIGMVVSISTHAIIDKYASFLTWDHVYFRSSVATASPSWKHLSAYKDSSSSNNKCVVFFSSQPIHVQETYMQINQPPFHYAQHVYQKVSSYDHDSGRMWTNCSSCFCECGRIGGSRSLCPAM